MIEWCEVIISPIIVVLVFLFIVFGIRKEDKI
jgi:hypothetical protein